MRSSRFTLLLLVVCLTFAREGLAWKQFQDAWQDHYLEEHSDEEFVTFCEKKAKCYVCHQGKKKSQNNLYGKRFEGELTKKDRKDDEKILAVIKAVGLEKVDPDDESSPTFDALIASGKLPAGELEDLKKEPEGAEGGDAEHDHDGHDHDHEDHDDDHEDHDHEDHHHHDD